MVKANDSMTVGNFVAACEGLDRDEVLASIDGVHLTDSENLLNLLDLPIERNDLREIMEQQESYRAFAEKAKKVKKPAPVSRAQWLDKAPAFVISLGDQELEVKPKEFKTGSFGSYGQGIVTLVVDGVEVPCRVSMNVVVQNSKFAS